MGVFRRKLELKHPRVPRNPFRIPVQGWMLAFGRTLWNAIDSDVSLRCAGVAFYSFIAIFPTVAIGVLLFGLLADPNMIENWVTLLGDVIPQQVVDIVDNRLDILLNQRTSDLSIGLAISVAVALWSGSRGIDALLYALTRAHEVHESRGTVIAFLFSILLTVGAITTSILVLTGVAVVPAILAALPDEIRAEQFALWFRWPFLALLIFSAITILYRIGPFRRDPSWRRVMPGAALATILWVAVSSLFSAYVENFDSYDVMFGSLAATVILMLWLYYSVFIVIAGAMFNAELEYEARKLLVTS